MMSSSVCIALVGAPNSGKTTLYNWLTGSRAKTVNYPGATVEYSIGPAALHLQEKLSGVLRIMDTPGTYSLHPKSDDEKVTLRALYAEEPSRKVDGVIVVVDGTQMARHLLLAEQVYETGFPMLLVITMADLLRKQNIDLDLDVLRKRFDCEVLLFDGRLAGGLIEVAQAALTLKSNQKARQISAWDLDRHEKVLLECEELAQKVLSNKTKNLEEKMARIHANTERIDRVLLHPWLGLLLFLGIMAVLFSSIFWVAAPFMDLIDNSFGQLSDSVANYNENSLFFDFLGHGVIASFGAFLVFVPQIFILFFGIGILESSGYLARAATLIDRPFSKMGMSGRSFVPILSGFACAVPAMIATRNISSTRDRWITTFVIPLMTCSARLPVYALFIAFLFHDRSPWLAGLTLAALYMGSLIVGGIAASVVHRLLPKNDQSFFMMELPIYRMPRWSVLLRQALTRSYSYVKKAGPAIFVFAILIWAGTNFPRSDIEGLSEQQKLEQSYAGQLGHVIEPIVHPMGADWRVGIGLISAFAAREVFVSSLAVTFNITDKDEDATQTSLLDSMKDAVNRYGEKVFTPASVAALLVFFMIALQCMATFAIAIREMNSLKFALTQLVAFNLGAYVLAVIIYQGLSAFGFGS